MGKCVIGSRSEIDFATSLTGSYVGDLPPTNLTTQHLSQVWRAIASGDPTALATLPASVVMDCFALINTNLGYSDTWMVDVSADAFATYAYGTGPLPGAGGQRVFTDRFDGTFNWLTISGAGDQSLSTTSSFRLGPNILVSGNNNSPDDWFGAGPTLIEFDPNALYSIHFFVRRTAGAGLFRGGWIGYAADGTTQVDVNGGTTPSLGHWHAAVDVAPQLSTFQEYSGYTKGWGASVGTGTVGTYASPGQMHPNVRYIRPYIRTNSTGTGVMQLNGAFAIKWVANPEGQLVPQAVYPLPAGKSATGSYVRLTARSPRLDYVDIGRFFAGQLWRPERNISYDWSRITTDTSPKRRSIGGQVYSRRRPKYEGWRFDLSFMSAADMRQALALDRLAGTTEDVLFVLDPDAADPGLDAVWGQIAQPSEIVNPHLRLYSKSYEVEQRL